MSGRVARNVASGWVEFAAGVAVSLLLTPFVIHRTGVEAYGIFLLLESLLSYSNLLYLGLGSAIIRYSARARGSGDRDELHRLAGTVLAAYLGCGALVALGAWFGAPWLPRWFDLDPAISADAVLVARLVGISTGLSFPASVFSGLLRGHERLVPLSVVTLLEMTLRVVLLVAFLEPEGALRTLGIVAFASSLFAAAARVLLSIRLLGILPDPRLADRGTLRRIAGFSLFSFLGNLGEQFLHKTDNIVIGAFRPSGAITSFAVPARLVEYGRQVIQRLGAALQPTFARQLGAGDRAGAGALLQDGARWAVLVTVPIVSGLAIFGSRFLEIWIGMSFPDAGWILLFLLAAQLARAPAMVCSALLWGAGRVGWIAALILGEALCNLALSVWWIQVWGIVGVAAGTMVPAVLVSLLLPLLACRCVRVPVATFLWRSWARPLAAGMPMVAVHLLLRPAEDTGLVSLASRVAAGLALYLVAGWFGVLTTRERSLVRRRLPGTGF